MLPNWFSLLLSLLSKVLTSNTVLVMVVGYISSRPSCVAVTVFSLCMDTVGWVVKCEVYPACVSDGIIASVVLRDVSLGDMQPTRWSIWKSKY